jgi:hypothetical protein
MTADRDRDQTQRDADRIPDDELALIRNYLAQWSYTVGTETPEGVPLAKQLLRHSDALFSELEQAEGWRTFERERVEGWQERCEAAEARVAKVPALVEALREIHDYHCGCDQPGRIDLCVAQPTSAFDALAVWEQE